MPISLPASVRASLGEEGADDFVRWLDDYLQTRTVHRDEYREVPSRLDVLEERIVQLEERIDQHFEQVDQRFEQVEQRFEQMEQRFEQVDKRFEQVDQRFEQMDGRIDAIHDRIDQKGNEINARIDRLHEAMRVQTRWTIGTIALFGTIVTVLLAVAEFTA